MTKWREKLKHPVGITAVLIASAAGILIVSVLLLSFIIGRKPLEESTGTVRLPENMGEDIEAVSDYLTQIHTLVNYNSGQLEEISSYSDSYHISLGEFGEETILCIENNITKIAAYLKDLEERIAETESRLEEENNRQELESLLLSEQLSRLHQKVAAGEQSIKNLLESLQNNEAGNAEDIRGEFDRLSGLIAELGKGAEDLYGDIRDKLMEMQDGEGENYTEMVAFLTTIQEDLIVNAQSIIMMMQENSIQTNEIISAEIERIKEEITGRIEELSETLITIDRQIIQTQETISSILSLSKSDNTEGFRQTAGLIEQVELVITGFREDMYAADQELFRMMELLQAEGKSDHVEITGRMEELSDTFITMDRQIIQTQETISGILSLSKSDNAEGFQQTAGLIGQIEHALTNIQKDMNAANQGLSEIIGFLQTGGEIRHAEMLSILSDMQGSLQALINSQTGTVNNSINNLKIYMESSMSTINQKLDSVFLYVSNGKKLLASALLTKNVTVTEDATFKNIADAIMNIPQKIVIGVEELPGTISYEYHYHTGTEAQGAGCYTKPVYHAHSSSCYKNSRCSCGGFQGNHNIDKGCTRCGHHFDHHWSLNDSGKYVESSCTLTTTVLNCNKAGTIEKYNLACGFSNGQIIGAHIVYGSTVQNTEAVMSMQAVTDESKLEAEAAESMEPVINEQSGTEEAAEETGVPES